MGEEAVIAIGFIAAACRAIWYGVSMFWLNNLENRMRELEYQRLEETE